jgi:VanZ family protein
MLPLSYPRRWQVAGILLLASVLLLAIVPAIWFWPQDPGKTWSLSDKWLHGITFAVLALWFSGQYAREAYWKLAVGLLAFGALIEICQRMISYRTAEWNDLFADMLGIAIGILIASIGVGGWSVRIERQLQNRIG